MRRRRGKAKSGGRIIARYDYLDERGNLLYQVRRYDPKNFTVHAAGGKKLDAASKYRRVPYRLPELLHSHRNQTVFVVEGEKDADRLWSEGLIATCNAFGGGKGKWTRGHSQHLRGRMVIFTPIAPSTSGDGHFASIGEPKPTPSSLPGS
jgi:hypothetical protein